MDVNLTIILLALIFSGFFSGIEIAYYSANKLKIELKRKQNMLSARLLSYFINHPSYFMTNTLVGNNIALVIYGIYMQVLLSQLIMGLPFEWLHYGFAKFIAITIISSMVVLIFAEFLPKALFRANPNVILSYLSWPFTLFYYLFYPLNIFVVWISKIILKHFLRVKVEESKPVFNHYDLFDFVRESNKEEAGGEIELDTQIFKNAIDFPNIRVRECMIPRTELVAKEKHDSLDELRQQFVDTGHSKILIYKENIDNIVGYVHIIDLFKNPASIDEILMPITIATEAMQASELLKNLIEKHRSMAVVVDEFGGTSGVITVEDIIEEIFGEIRDEHDQEELVEKQVDDKEYIFSARLEIDYINEQYNLNLPEGDYETLGGLILNIHEDIPKKGEVISYDP
ncbi:MAG: hemolysin, partial [Bacteroidetes bacterium SW_10_40_5]